MATEKKDRAALAAAPEPDPEPAPEEPVAERPPPLMGARGEQLTFAGMPVSDQDVGLIGPVTLTPELLAGLALGQTITLRVSAVVKSVSGKSARDDWGDDRASVRWQLYADATEVIG